MDLQHLQNILEGVYGKNNVKAHARSFRVIVEYENMPYCVVFRVEDNRLTMERDSVDQDEANYDEAYKKAYKLFIQNKDKFGEDITD
jgi:hypothetical protein